MDADTRAHMIEKYEQGYAAVEGAGSLTVKPLTREGR